jgi:glycerol kinase
MLASGLSPLARLLQGTQSTRFVLYDKQCQPLSSSQVEFPQIYPRAG